MLPDWINGIVARIAQDLITTLAGILISHGIMTSSQEQSFIGAAFFLVMLAINAVLHKVRAADNQTKGAVATLDAVQSQGKAS